MPEDRIAKFLSERPWWASARVSDDRSASQLFRWSPDKKHALLREAYEYGLSEHDVRILADSPGAILYLEPKQSIVASSVLIDGENVDRVWDTVLSGYMPYTTERRPHGPHDRH